MQQLDPVQFSRAQAEIGQVISADRAFDLIYHLCDALYDNRFVATSAVLEDALDTYLAERKRIQPQPLIDTEGCPPQAGERLRRAIANMRVIEDGFETRP